MALAEMALPRIPILSLCLALAIVFAIGIFDWRRSHHAAGRATITDQDVDAEMRLRAEQAVEAAARDFRTALDYSPDSVGKVEDILAEIHDRHLKEPLTDSELVKGSLRWGAYVGEVIKKVRPCRWALDSTAGGEGSLPVVYDDRSESFPVRWCYNRIKNGDEDNILHKFTILVLDRVRDGKGARSR